MRFPGGNRSFVTRTGMTEPPDLLRMTDPPPNQFQVSFPFRLIGPLQGSGFPLTYRRPSSSDIRIGGFVILPQRVPYPVFRQKDPLQIGMPREANSEEVIDLPLVPIGCD